uniref:Uncharacterized protein n=1 Tax=Anguilla anguilla TaxID=7936 RepID=A0A0E9R674_ANGAN
MESTLDLTLLLCYLSNWYT